MNAQMLINNVTSNNMAVIVDVQKAVQDEDLPSDEDIQGWIESVLINEENIVADQAELTVRIVDENEISELNQQYRQKKGSTNVLSFPVDEDLPLDIPLLGDLVICAAVVKREALEQNKSLTAHWAHMIVHGTLHLLGYDHIDDEQATRMEQKEITILHGLGFSNPYEVTIES
jgi:probable rRNA maturation factor